MRAMEHREHLQERSFHRRKSYIGTTYVNGRRSGRAWELNRDLEFTRFSYRKSWNSAEISMASIGAEGAPSREEVLCGPFLSKEERLPMRDIPLHESDRGRGKGMASENVAANARHSLSPLLPPRHRPPRSLL